MPEHNTAIQKYIKQILSSYGDIRAEPFATNDSLWGNFEAIIDHITASKMFARFPHIEVQWSVGKGNWAQVPWIALLDHRETEKTSSGIYIVILFRNDLSGVYLTLGQGSTEYSTLSAPIARQKMQDVAQVMRPDFKHLTTQGFLLDDGLDLRANSNRAKTYRAGTVTYKFYSEDALPGDQSLLSDIESLLEMYDEYVQNKVNSLARQNEFLVSKFVADMIEWDFKVSGSLAYRFISTLCAKPFVILTGLSGSGKTKLAQTFAQWICESPAQYCIVPVGADWTSREPLLGYANALETGKYVKPDNRALDLLLEAIKKENKDKPFFLILDEMNLSHVERYFADFLSVMESEAPLTLHAATDDWNESDVPASVTLPPNLFVIGTVNIDETTYMFSPKVLDRAGVIEFRVSADEMAAFLTNPVKPKTASLAAGGATMAADFVAKATGVTPAYAEAAQLSAILLGFFGELQQVGAEFGYRSASEIARFAGMVTLLTEANPWSIDQIADAAILQKLLPKLHGSRRQLEPVLIALAGQCVSDQANIGKWLLGDAVDVGEQRFPLTLEKLGRMYRRLMQDGFTSFAEA